MLIAEHGLDQSGVRRALLLDGPKINKRVGQMYKGSDPLQLQRVKLSSTSNLSMLMHA